MASENIFDVYGAPKSYNVNVNTNVSQSPYQTGQAAFQQSQQNDDEYETHVGPSQPHTQTGQAVDTTGLLRGGDTVNNTTAWDSFVDAADAGFFNMASGFTNFVGDTLESDMMKDFAKSLKERAEFNTESEKVLEGDNARWIANAVGNAVGSSVPTMVAFGLLQAGGSALGVGGALTAAAGRLGTLAPKVAQTTGFLTNLANKYPHMKTLSNAMSSVPAGSLRNLQLARLIGNIPEAMSEAGMAIDDADRMGKTGWERTKVKWGVLGKNAVALTAADMFQNSMETAALRGLGIGTQAVGLKALLEGGPKTWGTALARAGAMGIVGAPKEGGEEFVQNYIQDSSLGRPFDYDQAVKEFKSGAVGGLFLGGAGGIITSRIGNDRVDMIAEDAEGKKHLLTAYKGGAYEIDGNEVSSQEFYDEYNGYVPDEEKVNLEDYYNKKSDKYGAHYGLTKDEYKDYTNSRLGLEAYPTQDAAERKELDNLSYEVAPTYDKINKANEKWKEIQSKEYTPRS